MDHSVRVSRSLRQAVGIVEIAALDDGARGFEPLRRVFGASQADDLVAGFEEFGHDARADPARCAGDEDSHGGTSQW